ncbi:hypothetical protein TrLO_g12352 [Triparma laevis f. longispina]|uniref:Prokaryotic-type class I peptide chain release factors domain-containing protein n=1 Tax=Triparma laevis f. longispina TaxID=1714387 RepID=A0A9W7L0V5_9STRA|nr:hypothetical protein TrLO_g12352 [Triparma laevis f. longispina]
MCSLLPRRLHSSFPHYLRTFTTLPPAAPPSLSSGISRHLERRERRWNDLQVDLERAIEDGSSSLIGSTSKNLSSLSPLIESSTQYTALLSQRLDLIDMLTEEPSLLPEILPEIESIDEEIVEVKLSLTGMATEDYMESQPTSPPSSESVILEVRPGTGGDEATLFAMELFKAYEKTAKQNAWSFTPLTFTPTSLNGLKEGVAEVTSQSSEPLYTYLHLESGVHRVQRVPFNSPKLQTSTANIIVLPSTVTQDFEALDPSTLKFETFRASGAGGQHVNTTDSAIRCTHIPTGIKAEIQDERSQHKNKAAAIKLVTARVHEVERLEEEERVKKERGKVVSTGERGDRVRTYNFKEDRITDHRSGETVYGIQGVLEGGNLWNEFWGGLRDMRRKEVEEMMEEEEE